MTACRQLSPVSVRISVTDRCQLRCSYCMPAGGVPKLPPEEILSFEEICRFVRVLQSHFDLRKVHVTGGEPLMRRGVVDLVAMLASLRLRDLVLTTNGQRLAGLAAELARAGLQRVNVSLDSVRSRTFETVTGGGDLARTLAGIREAVQVGLLPVKTNTVVLRGINDAELPDIVRCVLAWGCHARFLELMPIGYARPGFAERHVPAAEIRAKLEASLELVPLAGGAGQTSQDFAVTDRSGLRGTVGLISSESRPFCAGCRRLRLTSTGRLISCLARDEAVPLRHLLRTDSAAAAAALRELIAARLEAKQVRTSFETARAMVTVGG